MASVFISYAHEDQPLARAIAAGLRTVGHDVWIDEDGLRVGDSLIERIATAIHEMEFVVALVSEASVQSPWCQKELALAITGGLGREGVKVLPLRVGDVTMPPTLMDIYHLHVDPTKPEAAIERLRTDIDSHHEERAQASRQRHRASAPVQIPADTASGADTSPGPIRIVGIVEDGVGQPRDDDTPGSALYRVPLRLSRTPSLLWARLFVETWDRPPSFTSMHRPGIASVEGDTIVLDGTTIEELETVHVQTLQTVLRVVNEEVERREDAERQRRVQAEEDGRAHAEHVREVAGRLRFGDPVDSAQTETSGRVLRPGVFTPNGLGYWLPRYRHALVSQDESALCARFVTVASLPADARPRVDDAARTILLEALRTSALEGWLSRQMGIWRLEHLKPWRVEGRLNTSWGATVLWDAMAPDGHSPLRAQCVVELPTTSADSLAATLILDVVALPGRLNESMTQDLASTPMASAGPHFRFSVQQFFALLVTGLETIAADVPDRLLPSLLGSESFDLTSPTCLAATWPEDIGHFVNLDGARRIPETSPTHGANLIPRPDLNLLDDQGRRAQVREWLTEMFLNHGLRDVDAFLDANLE